MIGFSLIFTTLVNDDLGLLFIESDLILRDLHVVETFPFYAPIYLGITFDSRLCFERAIFDFYSINFPKIIFDCFSDF